MVKLNRIYTRTGDDGTTGLVDGSRVAKDDARMEAIGAVDEANSTIGFAIVALESNALDHDTQQGSAAEIAGKAAQVLRRVQNDLFDLGADLATPGDDFAPSEKQLRMTQAQAVWIERCIDAVNSDLQPLASFILPGGIEGAARMHLARSQVRRAERAMAALASTAAINPAAQQYINRLSDLLFVQARALNNRGMDDVLWTPGANRG
ncbi:cob(I)yrinic acid a,c-diamide adenosyltransferase [Croceicoccus sp. F390]|uniref:Corrinoid adenosyltransferase n=1 Tax=Croceicoccus esteveae TaxID=3075597 RepID=A0ABU2ZL71_9SPHN|nr:cob(I)yrinic acid a,c-diamide adenosyltransferase [Croceicoccus sp. F390]MDT0576798.1 cob(I)yrinic acid a,c-diamide adenosyltransferase [Croceicoccus sp. F390]